jgi:hypothetical protein
MVNRSAITITAKQPFLDWIRNLPDSKIHDTTLEEINEESNVYLLPEWEDDQQRDGILREYFDDIFIQELNAWWTSDKDWPKDRNIAMFKKWFEIQYHSIVEDLGENGIFDLDY